MLIPKRALGYFSDDKGSWFLAPLNDSVVGPTNVYTNIPDLTKWDENFYTGRIGGPDLVQRMYQPGSLDDGTPLEYGWGFDVGEAFVHRGWRTVEHSGSHGGYTSHMLRIPELHMSVIFMSNYFNMLATEMAWKVADLFLEQKPGTSSITSKEKKADLSLEPIPTTWAGMYFAPERDALREVKIKRGILYYEGRELVRISQHGFSILHDESAHIEIQDGLGGVPTLDVIIPNGKFHYEKVMIIKKSKVETAQYTGRYYSPELDVYWIVDTSESSSLVIKRRKYPTTHLTPVFEDAFRDDWQPIVEFPYKFLLIFTRNAKKEITGLRVSGAGPRRLRFDKC
jgi:hypothetical protein